MARRTAQARFRVARPGLESTPHRAGTRRLPSSGQSLADERPLAKPRAGAPRRQSQTRGQEPAAFTQPAQPRGGALGPSRRALDLCAGGCRHPGGVRCPLQPRARLAFAQSLGVDAAAAHRARQPAQRGGHRKLAGGALAGVEKKAQANGWRVVFIDESGFYLLPGLATHLRSRRSAADPAHALPLRTPSGHGGGDDGRRSFHPRARPLPAQRGQRGVFCGTCAATCRRASCS